MAAKYDDYINFLKKYRDQLSFFLDNECEKRRSLLSGDMARVEAVLKLQQAESMKFSVMEAKRTELQAELGLHGDGAKALLLGVTDEAAGETIGQLFAEMTALSKSLREQNRQSLELAKNNLKVLDIMRGEKQETPDVSPVYSPRTTHPASMSGRGFEETV